MTVDRNDNSSRKSGASVNLTAGRRRRDGSHVFFRQTSFRQDWMTRLVVCGEVTLRLVALAASLAVPGIMVLAQPPTQPSSEPASKPASEPATEHTAAEQKYPDLLDGTLSGKGDQDEIDSPHSGLFRMPTLLEPWFEFKMRRRQEHGIAFGGSYGVLWQNYSQSLIDQHNAVSGKFALNFGYELLNRGQSDALWLEMVVEDRHDLGTDFPPFNAGLAAGSTVPTASTWGELDLGISQAYIRQDLFDHRFQYAIGRLFAPSFINAYPLMDDNRSFLNQSFSISPTIAAPLRGFGAVGAVYPIEDSRMYVQAGMYTANSADSEWTVDDFFTKGEHFYHVEIGQSGLARSGVPVQARGASDRDNYHVLAWYRNEQEDGPPEAYGVAFNANHTIHPSMMVFLRGGWSSGFFIDTNVSAGFGYYPSETSSDQLGFGVSWAHPSSDALRDQYTAELFYRFHVTPNFAITPDIQVIVDPALDPSEDVLCVVGLRTRVTF
jgi:carbohydrate-selective porin OprB